MFCSGGAEQVEGCSLDCGRRPLQEEEAYQSVSETEERQGEGREEGGNVGRGGEGGVIVQTV